MPARRLSEGGCSRDVSSCDKLDVFNALNSDDYTSVSTNQFGASAYQRPSVILLGRIARFGVDLRW